MTKIRNATDSAIFDLGARNETQHFLSDINNIMKHKGHGSKNLVMIVKLTYFGREFETKCASFRPASTGLGPRL